jgi:hypothetical protein
LLALPVADFDSLSYLLPRVVEWYHSGQFATPLAQFGAHPINSYPYAWNTLSLLTVASMGHDQFVLAPNLVAWLILGLAIYRLARLCGGAPTACLGTATLAMLMPVTLTNIRSAHVDLALAAFFVAAAYFIADALDRGHGDSALMAIASVVMMLGTKMSGLPYAAVLVGFCLWLGVHRYATDPSAARWPRVKTRHVCVVLLVAVASGLAGLSWYVHNALVHGNPLGVIQVSILGHVVWDGSVTSESVARTDVLHNFHLIDPRHWAIALAAAIEQLGVPGLALSLGAVGSVRLLWRQSAPRGLLLAVLGLGLVSFWLYLATPWSGNDGIEHGITPFMSREVRYGMPFLSLLSVLAGAAHPAAPRHLVVAALVVGALLGAMAAADPWQRQGAAALKWQVVVAIFTVLMLWSTRLDLVRRLQTWTSRARVPALTLWLLVIGLAVLGTTVAALATRHRSQYTMFGGIARFVDQELPPGKPIGFSGTHATHLLFGTRLQQRLKYVPLQRSQTLDALAAELRGQGLAAIAVGPRIGQAPSFPSMLRDAGGPFVRLHGRDLDSEVVVYGLRPSD